ncbi:uncharacterized protein EKO05_0006999 [Ascochyta rabiei]|uniref:Uncharacterized protein n=1 Tax=Didymella rabiei TaxID=5454 RepID=A0A162Z6U6_DIDRA|nr:uncharacterized protein EKO05_0006999 [Ascochyta rabiei]KZM20427.1 hypothetical protein ST47_g8439 [Ascochyta rabiei]UPX16608.1 hypothetical protein EKO05_0006999 [Ascochyta rabiei]
MEGRQFNTFPSWLVPFSTEKEQPANTDYAICEDRHDYPFAQQPAPKRDLQSFTIGPTVTQDVQLLSQSRLPRVEAMF